MFNNYSYLYVEDDPMSREIMAMIFEHVLDVDRFAIFEDSTDFMARLKALPYKPQIILLDIHMQPHTGFELLTTLRADRDFRDATVIALTASVMNEEIEELRASGFDGAIAKPLSLKGFSCALERLLIGESVWHIAEV